ncbi:MAG: FliM/FliN family flagellar motor switch protein [Bryobacteraceae bacterium]|jgi:flagellar motor switch protein FliM
MSTAGLATENEKFPACPPGYLPAGFAQDAERIHRAFLDILAPALAGMLQTPVSTALLTPAQSTSGDFLDEHESAGCLVALDLSPLNGSAILSFSRELLFGVLDIFTATPAIADNKPRETVTAIELHILQEFFDAFREALSNAWRPIYPLAFDILAIGPEKSRQAASTQSLQAMIVLKSRIQFGEGEAAFEIALPGFLLRLAEVNARQLPAREGVAGQVQESLLAALGEAALQVDAVLNGSGVRIGDLLSIRPGQILSLGTPPDAVFECLVNGKSRFRGEMIAGGGRQAFRVDAPV